jgi:hypothetical protein
MRWMVIGSFCLIVMLFLPMVIIFASATNGLFQIDNYNKAALSGELVRFDMTLVNNEANRETFIIHHVWENTVLWLPMDLEDNPVYDYSSFRNHGTVYGASWVGGKYGKALNFDGIDDYVEANHSSSLDVSTGITLMAWVKPQDMSEVAWNAIISHGGYYGDGKGYSFIVMLNRIRVELQGLTPEYLDIGGLNLSNDVWYFVVATYSGSKIELFVNSKSIGSVSATGTILPSESTLRVGDRYNNDRFKGITDEVRIYNRALTAEEIGWLYNNSWSESLSRNNVKLEPGESAKVTFTVKVPEDSRAGHVQKFLLTAFPLSNPEHVETKTVTVEVLPKYDVEVSLDENEKKGKPGEILNFQASIRNLGSIEDTYDIHANGGEGWNLSLPAESLTVPAEEVGSFNISVTVPLDALPGDYTSFRIQAASRGNQTLTTNVNGTAIATAIYRFNITADPEVRQVSPGSDAIFSLELKNFGTAPDTISLEAENLIGWDIEVDPSNISLEIGETGKATVRVRVPEAALIGQTSAIKLHVVSTGDPTVSANSSISIEVVTPFWDIPDVRFIVGLSIGVLLGATLISTLILRRAQIIRKESRRS